MKTFLLALVLLLVSFDACALVPTPGLWYAPTESGRGFNIDLQNNTLVITSYVYTSAGSPTWYLSVGSYDKNSHTWSGTLDGYSNGQCFGCGYKKPTATTGAGGTVKIIFDTIETGTIFYPGGSSPIRHYIYGFNGQTGYFLGEWAFAYNNAGTLTSQWAVFNSYYTGSNGTVYASGGEDAVSGTSALGAYDPASASFVVAIDNGHGQEYLYQLNGDSNRMLGYGTTTPEGVTPTALQYVAAGTRLLAQYELSTSSEHNVNDFESPRSLVVDESRFEHLAARLQEFIATLPKR